MVLTRKSPICNVSRAGGPVQWYSLANHLSAMCHVEKTMKRTGGPKQIKVGDTEYIKRQHPATPTRALSVDDEQKWSTITKSGPQV